MSATPLPLSAAHLQPSNRPPDAAPERAQTAPQPTADPRQMLALAAGYLLLLAAAEALGSLAPFPWGLLAYGAVLLLLLLHAGLCGNRPLRLLPATLAATPALRLLAFLSPAQSPVLQVGLAIALPGLAATAVVLAMGRTLPRPQSPLHSGQATATLQAVSPSRQRPRRVPGSWLRLQEAAFSRGHNLSNIVGKYRPHLSTFGRRTATLLAAHLARSRKQAQGLAAAYLHAPWRQLPRRLAARLACSWQQMRAFADARLPAFRQQVLPLAAARAASLRRRADFLRSPSTVIPLSVLGGALLIGLATSGLWTQPWPLSAQGSPQASSLQAAARWNPRAEGKQPAHTALPQPKAAAPLTPPTGPRPTVPADLTALSPQERHTPPWTPQPQPVVAAVLWSAPQCTAGGYENYYPYGECTWYAKAMRPDLPWFSGDDGHAMNWATAAERCGLPVDGVPAVGAIAVFPATEGAPYGHVVYVEAVESDYLLISECHTAHTDGPSWWAGDSLCGYRHIALEELPATVRFIH